MTDKENAPPAVGNNNVTLDFFGQAKTTPSPFEISASIYKDIQESVQTKWKDAPLHTIQRLAELVLQPKRYYQYLPPYLQALNRVVHVSSNTSTFPLPQTNLAQSTTASVLVNGNRDSALGSDESLGGALLTPIPWLTRNSPSGSDGERDIQDTAQRLQDQQTVGIERELGLHPEGSEIVQGPNGAGSVETVSIINGGRSGVSSDATAGAAEDSPSSVDAELRAEGAVTQGELLRLEQEAGVVPVPSRRGIVDGNDLIEVADAEITGESAEESEEVPHARGPEEIGVEDTGPQTGTGGVAGLLKTNETTSISSTDPKHDKKDEKVEEEKEDDADTKMEVDEPAGEKDKDNDKGSETS